MPEPRSDIGEETQRFQAFQDRNEEPSSRAGGSKTTLLVVVAVVVVIAAIAIIGIG